MPEHVHLVGSVGLPSVEDVFRTCGRSLGRRLQRIPDGEPGGRRLWVSWQIPLLRACPFFQVAQPLAQGQGIFGALRLADGVKPADVRFDELGYALEARSSYVDFLDAKQRGDIAPHVRFQVSLPTPYAVTFGQFTPEALPIAFKAYTEAMLREVEKICARIPHQDLCIQWDVCFEMVIWDGSGGFFRWNLPGNPKEEIVKHLKHISEAVPADVELGYHLCYGDLDAKHFFNPKDAGAIVEIVNAIAANVGRPIAYMHLPVPIERTDEAFFQPFDALAIDGGTELFLGVVHARDGIDGLNARIAAASKHIRAFGIATECGMARARVPEVVQSILNIHVAGSSEPSAS
jgi:hypothetical protein